MANRRIPLAYLASGQGRLVESSVLALRALPVAPVPVLLATDRPGCPAVDRARRLGLDIWTDPEGSPGTPGWEDRLGAELRARGVGIVVLAGFLRVLRHGLLKTYAGRILNVHPSLLPRHRGQGMYGHHVHEAVLRSQDRETGATVHLVTEDLDAGPILAQARVPVFPTDTPETLAERLRPVETQLLVTVLREIQEGRRPWPEGSGRRLGEGGRTGDTPPSSFNKVRPGA
jgi:phosphoribosylglycinamide formyltransferase-1